MNGKLIFGAIIILVLVVGGYFVYTNYSPAAPANEQQEAFTNVQIQDVTVGEGAEAVPGSIVSVLYEGRLEDGTVFDSSEAYGNEPLVFVLGAEGLIPGFQVGVNGMREGGERILAVPASLGYGAQEVRDPEGTVIIPANATLIFNVILVNVEEAATPEETTTE